MQTVKNTDELRQALAAGHKPDSIEMAHPITQAQLDAAVATAKAEGVAEGKQSASEGAIRAERERVAELHAMSRKGFDAELKVAIDGGHSAENFAYSMLKAAQDRGITLDAIAADAPKALPHAKAPADDPNKAHGAATSADELVKKVTTANRM
jgi:capsid assembly protease